MNLLKRIDRKLRTKYFRSHFMRSVQPSRELPTLDAYDDSSDVVLLSMVQKKDVEMFLLAAYSFLQHLKVNRIHIVADPTLDDDDKAVMRKVLGRVEFSPATEHRTSGIPTGGCWERISGIAALLSDNYVIQLDADTLTMRRPDEVIECVNARRAFTLGTRQGREFWPLQQATDFALSHMTEGHNHIQLLAEAKLNELPTPYKYYVRGNAGFAAYPQESFSVDELEKLSGFFTDRLSTRWADWGSEQFTSNLLVANQPDALILPHEYYCVPARDRPDPKFLHFIGDIRFMSFSYAKAAKQILTQYG